MKLFQRFMPQQNAPSPTNLLVSLLAQRIVADCLSTNMQIVRSYYDSHRWLWKEKGIHIDCNTESYGTNARASSIKQLVHYKHSEMKSTIIELSPDNERVLVNAINLANTHATRMVEAEKVHDNELKSCDALASVLGI